ncbi:short-chain dehydrogenase/reductase SDR [Desulfovibrio sp. X2]|uniref:SDR family NAD(P)-dependent oxidoreductase n=1 Tax=Desulfovibrio sp. X2 TaxID=941449 RepID=UPI000358D14C|nr:SDR family oxidoreductase [Desulfovibrio sp. X2]EPR41172.1 short-chain dehydrogenase/reductase SDR [Desulfovibrio sp. X2]
MELSLKGRTALVSGSTAGIGLAIAEALAREGASVVVNGRTQKRVDEAVLSVTRAAPGAMVRGVAADLSLAEGAKEFFAAVPAADILVNNLGIYAAKDFADISDQDWLHMLDVNVLSGARLSRRYLPGMLERGWGRVIFVSSESGLNIPAEMIHYGVSKAAVLALSRGLALLTRGTAVTVNSVLPGPTRSEGVQKFISEMAGKRGGDTEAAEREFFRDIRPTSLIQRFEEPAEIADLVAFVASPRASGINGAALRVEGGVVNVPF